ncbi:hypothetical protein [Streptosporangium sandarakinum]|uniref:Uncharacterized protein n=1 Tax=Streptosporangium sandarakinum TaxID=1260955 RepID=A0A852V4R6_9ACTN|nr:hypothetical protein [Streptosporangium sandarakinum]NYF43090.1 hypothetical protein [Streptosporangium sandarakinum]
MASTGAACGRPIWSGGPYRLKDPDDGSWLAVITKPTKLRRSQKDRLREDARHLTAGHTLPK